MTELALRQVALVMANDRRRWRIAESTAYGSIFSAADVWRLLMICDDNVDEVRTIVRRASLRAHSLADAHYVTQQLLNRGRLATG